MPGEVQWRGWAWYCPLCGHRKSGFETASLASTAQAQHEQQHHHEPQVKPQEATPPEVGYPHKGQSF